MIVRSLAVLICIGEQAVHLHVYREAVLHVPSDSKYGSLLQLRSHIFRRVISLTWFTLPNFHFSSCLADQHSELISISSSENFSSPAGCFLIYHTI